MKKILIIGKNSYIGNSFCNYVKSSNSKSWIVDMVGASDGQWEKVDFTGYDTIMHLAAIVHKKEDKYSKQIYFDINCNLAVTVAKKAKISGVRQFIFISTMAVYGSKVEKVTKETIPDPDTWYGKSKFKAEKEIKKIESDNFKIVIVRPPMVYGNNCKGNYKKLVKLAKYLLFFPRVLNVRSIISIDTLCEYLENIIYYDLNGYYYPQDMMYISTYTMFRNIRKNNGKNVIPIPIFNKLFSYLIKKSKLFKKIFGNCYYDYELPTGNTSELQCVNNEDPIVSVIIPAYNSVKYVKKAIDSVVIQKVPLEIVIINDYSSDNLDEIIEKYQNKHNIVYIKNQINMGVAESRNIGIKASKGKYIAFLDADDWWMPGKLQKQLEVMEQKKCVLSYTARRIAVDDDLLTGKIINVKTMVDYNTLLYHNCISCSSVVIRREAAIAYPMEHSELHEDYLTWLKILKKYGIAYGINQPFLIYRMSHNSKTSNKINSAKMTYGVYRVLNIGKVKAFILMCSHLLHGIIKFGINSD